MFDFRNSTAKQFSAKLSAVAKAATKLQEDIHGLCMFALLHLNQHTNSTPANDLLAALPKGQRREAVIFWFKSFGACSVQGETAAGKALEGEAILKFVNKENIRGADHLDAVLSKAEANPYFDWSKEAVKPVFNFDAETLLKSINRARDAAAHPDKYRELNLDVGLLDVLEDAISKYTSNQIAALLPQPADVVGKINEPVSF